MNRPCLPLWVALLLIVVAVASCDDDDESSANAIVFTREDGSTVQFPDARTFVWCGPWEADIVPTPTLHVQLVGASRLQGGGWKLEAVYGDFSPGDTLRFPNTFVWDQPDSAFIFLSDPPNELSTAQYEGPSGWIVFHRLPCSGEGEVAFDVDAVLASELADMPWVAMQGSFRHPVTGPPPWLEE